MSLLSAIIPIGRGNQSLVAALDGFLGQSVPIADVEIVLVTTARPARPQLPARHRRLTIRTTRWPRGGQLAAALNAGAKAARAPIVALLDPQWRPLPGLVDYCLQFHAREPGLADVLTLAPSVDPAIADDPLLWWLSEQQLAGLDRLSPGIHAWRALRFDALSCKTALLRRHRIPAAKDDERLMRTEWVKSAPLRVFVEPVPVLATAARPVLAEILARQYRASYARLNAMRASPQTFAGEAVDDRFQHPERYLLSPGDEGELADTIATLERDLAGHHPRFAVGAVAEQFAILGKLYLAAVSHARSAGWVDAKSGRARRVA